MPVAPSSKLSRSRTQLPKLCRTSGPRTEPFGLLRLLVGATGLILVAAWVRHRYAVAHDIEEPEPAPEETAAGDHERLLKLGKSLGEKL